MGLFLLSEFEEELSKMETEELMCFLNRMAKGDFFRDKKIVCKFRKMIKRFKLSEELMQQLRNEENVMYKISEKRINLSGGRADFKHYIEIEGKWIEVTLPAK